MDNVPYNGVELQDINTVWTDKTARPFASIVQYTDGTYVLILSDKSLGYRNGIFFPITNGSTTADFWIYDGSKWGFGATQTHGGYALEGYSFIWASYPVPNINAAGQEDGTIHLEASDSDQDGSDPDEPDPIVGYRYGDSPVLPDINTVWTGELKEKYPYVVFLPNLFFACFPLPVRIADERNPTGILLGHDENGDIIRADSVGFIWESDSNAWKKDEVSEFTAVNVVPIWTNHNLYCLDPDTDEVTDTLYLAASEPVPVYADPTPDLPTLSTDKDLSAILSGFQLGQAVRRMRGLIQPPIAPTGVYDDAWPIEWNQIAIADNKANFTVNGMNYRKISNLVPTVEMMDGACMEITQASDGESGGETATYEFIPYGSDNGMHMAMSTTYTVGIMSFEAPGDYDGITVTEAGLYYVFLDGNMDSAANDELVTFKLTIPDIDPVVITSGDGYTLYNGYKFSTVPEYDEEAHPYALITRTSYGAYGYLTTMFASSTPRYKHPDVDCLTIVEEQNYVKSSYTSNDEWDEPSYSTSNSIGDTYQSMNDIIWNNYDICEAVSTGDNLSDVAPSDVVAISASAIPISLDHKTVIEWNGDTSKFTSDSSKSFYKVIDTVLTMDKLVGSVYITSAKGVVKITDSMIVYSDGIVGIDNVIWSISTAGTTYNGMTFPETGLYMTSVDYVRLFAYN